ncbi:hypothetical protein GCM10023156_62050 [Novipirellula rosea]|uniref:Uncharacterized protein n=1 Tax=Novipirellula rosea TaxID=1031540 RepID=A0ABP8NMU8_9BACT
MHANSNVPIVSPAAVEIIKAITMPVQNESVVKNMPVDVWEYFHGGRASGVQSFCRWDRFAFFIDANILRSEFEMPEKEHK